MIVQPSHQYLRECFKMDGKRLIWRERPLSHFTSKSAQAVTNGRYTGKEAGSPTETGRRIGITYAGKACIYDVADVAYCLHTRMGLSELVNKAEFRNGDVTDLTFTNLRLSDARREEPRPKAPKNPNPVPKNRAAQTSDVPGVVYLSKRQSSLKWRARFNEPGAPSQDKFFKTRTAAEQWITQMRDDLTQPIQLLPPTTRSLHLQQKGRATRPTVDGAHLVRSIQAAICVAATELSEECRKAMTIDDLAKLLKAVESGAPK